MTRALSMLMLFCIAAAFPLLSAGHRVKQGGIHAIAFYVSFGLVFMAVLLTMIRANRLLTLFQIARCRPISTLFFMFNLYVSIICILYMLGKFWGFNTILLLGACFLFTCVALSQRQLQHTTVQILRCSPISFITIYMLWGVGEFFLRMNPMNTGGRGGGGPALTQLYADLYSFNSLGLRDQEFTLKRPDGTYRILALGDSFTFAQGVPRKDTYVEQLEARLTNAYQSTQFEVINAGKCGVNTTWEVDYLQNQGLQFEPNLITLQFYINDLKFNDYESKSNKIYNLLISPVDQSYALFWMLDRFNASIAPSDLQKVFAQIVENNGPGWESCKKALNKLAAISHSTEIPVVVILFPVPGKPNDYTKKIHQAVSKICGELNLAVIDLTDAFLSIDPADQPVSKIDNHPGPKVHHLAATLIYEMLSEKKLLPPNNIKDDSM